MEKGYDFYKGCCRDFPIMMPSKMLHLAKKNCSLESNAAIQEKYIVQIAIIVF